MAFDLRDMKGLVVIADADGNSVELGLVSAKLEVTPEVSDALAKLGKALFELDEPYDGVALHELLKLQPLSSINFNDLKPIEVNITNVVIGDEMRRLLADLDVLADLADLGVEATPRTDRASRRGKDNMDTDFMRRKNKRGRGW